MDRLAKLLKKLSQKERGQFERLLASLLSRKTYGLDIKKLKGTDDIYRARAGNFRVIFRKQNGDIRVLEASRRNEGTYGN
jgi:mRNA-degrading endonuclease RelE of RelBE toxin-antitoxin system